MLLAEVGKGINAFRREELKGKYDVRKYLSTNKKIYFPLVTGSAVIATRATSVFILISVFTFGF